MAEHDPVERRLALARAAAWAPAAAKGRVRANLAASGGLPTANAARAGTVTKLTTAVLVGCAFVTGYWLGSHRSAGQSPTAVSAGEVSSPDAPASPVGARSSAGESRPSPPRVMSSPPLAAPVPMPVDAAQAAAQPKAAPADAAVAPPGRSTRSVPSRAVVTRVPATKDPAAEELALLSRAERAIRGGEPALALSFVTELETRFPDSALLEERAAARLLAECALASPGARRRAELFLSDRAASVYTDRVRRSCALDVSPATPPASDGSAAGGH